jgi:hypothetical protein
VLVITLRASKKNRRTQTRSLPKPIHQVNRKDKMNRLFLVLCAAGAITLQACDSPKDVSKSNFEKVINEKLATEKLCIQPQKNVSLFGPQPFPATVPNVLPAPGLDRLVELGLLSKSPATSDGKIVAGGPQPGRMYSLTEKGQRSYGGPPKYEFCYGIPVVTKVVEYTEPSDMFGSHITRVTFITGLRDQADWSADREIQGRFHPVNTGSQAIAALELTSEGWKAREVRFSNN